MHASMVLLCHFIEIRAVLVTLLVLLFLDGTPTWFGCLEKCTPPSLIISLLNSDARANAQEPYIRTMPHSEYPSGSSCLCEVSQSAHLKGEMLPLEARRHELCLSG